MFSKNSPEILRKFFGIFGEFLHRHLYAFQYAGKGAGVPLQQIAKKEMKCLVHVVFTTGFSVPETVPGNTLRMPAVESRTWMVSE
jgi:hypothetical protein